MKTIIYLHGLSSSGQSSTARALRELLPDWEIISPDIPVHPQEALPMLRELCKDKEPDFVIGTSMGGMYAQQMHGYRKILVNPAFHVSKTLQKNLGVCTFFSPRQDGVNEFEITPALCEAFEDMEKCQFDAIKPFDIGTTMAFFGTNDELVDCREEYFNHYAYGMMFEGSHRLSRENLEKYIIKWILCTCYSHTTAKSNQIHSNGDNFHDQRICKKHGKYGLEGENNCIYDDLFLIHDTELYACRSGMKWGILKYTNEDNLITLVPSEMDVLFQCTEVDASLVFLFKEFKWGVVKDDAEQTYIPPIHDDWGWYNKDGVR